MRVSLNRNKVFNLRWNGKTTFKLQKHTSLLTLLAKRDLNCSDILPRNGSTQFDCFLGANKYTNTNYHTNYPDISRGKNP